MPLDSRIPIPARPAAPVPLAWRRSSSTARWLRRLAVLAAIAAAAACRSREADPIAPELISRNNIGVGQMGRFDFDQAVAQFRGLADARPDWPDARVNLAVALTNRQGEGDEAEAERLLLEVVSGSRPPLRARYVLGLLRLHAGRAAEALPDFQAVAAERPDDAFAAYFAGQSLLQLERPAEALEWYRRAMAAERRLRSAWYGAFVVLRRLGQDDEAQRMLARFQDLERNPQAMTAEFKYTRMGPLAEAAAVDAAEPPRTPAIEGPRFAEGAPLVSEGRWQWQPPAADRAASITTADVNGDGRLDLFIAGAMPGGGNGILLNQGEGRWALDDAHPLASVTGVNAALWGDYDNDGLVDVYLCRRTGSNQLWRQESPGAWRDVSRQARAGTAARDTVDGAMVDADHDGDLDIWLVNTAGRTELLNNNGDGTFRSIAREAGIAGDGRPARAIVISDFDGDRDADVLVLKAQPPHEMFINERVWTYRAAPGMERLLEAPIAAAIAGDLDADGRQEIYTTGPRGLERWREQADGRWDAERLAPASPDGGAAQVALADTDGDGHFEVVTTRGSSWAVIDPAPAPAGAAIEGTVPGLAGWTIAPLDPGRGPSVIALPSSGPPVVWKPGAGRHPFVTLSFTGSDTRSDQRRSNVSGIGARVAVRADSRWTAFETYRQHSGPGQSHQPVDVGVGIERGVDFVAITWPDGVYQTEIGLAPGALHRIEETQRQLSSCPVLFAFDGRGFAFVTDLLGVGGIGFFERPGVYGAPYPQENILLPASLPAPKDGSYQFKIAEPMEEAAYVDAAWLTAYDLPAGWQMTLDERKALIEPMPTGEPRFYRVERLPARAVNDRGEDVTEALRDADLRAAPPGRPDARFIGLTSEHAVTLLFDAPVEQGPGRPLLVADGWIEYPYAQTVFAAWQAGVPYRAPTLEARGADGRWRTILREFGYPAGMPRQMSVALERLPRGTRELRLSTTQEIYWDRLAVVYPEEAPDVRRTRLPLRRAVLAETGFARRSTGAQRVPHYDYHRRAPLWDTRHQRGFYTEFGRVDELVTGRDSALVILGPGEELHLEFDASLPPLAEGWARRLVLETRGWAKDMDLYTENGETIEPVPGDATAERARLHAKYNTRYDGGR